MIQLWYLKVINGPAGSLELTVGDLALEPLFLSLDACGILPVDACQAQVFLGFADGLYESVDTYVPETVGPDDVADLVHRVLVGDELISYYLNENKVDPLFVPGVQQETQVDTETKDTEETSGKHAQTDET